VVFGQGGLIRFPASLNSLLAMQTLFQVERSGTNGRMSAAIKLMGIMIVDKEGIVYRKSEYLLMDVLDLVDSSVVKDLG
jgi:hypothetical protein